ncbi:MAG: NADH-quinone oxidoreductase subunit NuoE [Gammaproteobacteria bacterium]|nr:MAG: NADH-quinone oxidoreductase subunit NuoE [Gammaproteobacteria bacterium]
MLEVVDRVGPSGNLSAEETQQIDANLSHYDHNRAVTIEALKIIQAQRGWVSDECLQSIAGYLKLAPAEVEGVATFYNLIYRQPVGKNVVRICDSVTCWFMGYEAIRDELKAALNVEYGQISGDGQYTLLPGPCMGACDCAPVMIVNDDLHTHLDAQKAKAIVSDYKNK